MIIHCQYGCNQCVLWILVNASTESNKIIKLVLLDKKQFSEKKDKKEKKILFRSTLIRSTIDLLQIFHKKGQKLIDIKNEV